MPQFYNLEKDMLRTLPQTRDWSPAYRIATIGAFVLISVVAARVSIPLDPVPFTLQPLAVLLAGMILGSRDGALSQLAYIALIAIGLPVDANARGSAAFAGPTVGYLFGFVAAAFVAGWLIERGANRVWQRWLAGVAGIATLYLCGIPGLMLNRGLDLSTAWLAGGAPFLLLDTTKAILAAAVTEGGRRLLNR